MSENYEVFEAEKPEKPEWWTEHLISTIPDDYIPTEELKLLDENGVGGKRKRSVVGLGRKASFVGGGEAEEGGGLAGLARRMTIGGKGRLIASVAPTPTPDV